MQSVAFSAQTCMSMKHKHIRFISLNIIPFIVAGAVMLLLSVSSCQEKDNGSKSRMQQLTDECRKNAKKNNFKKSDSLATILMKDAEERGDEHYKGVALYYLGNYNSVRAEAPSRLAKLKRAVGIADQINDDTLLCKAYNMLGIYETAYFKRYYMAQYYFSKSMKLGRQIDNKSYEMVAECNLSEVYRMLRDTTNISYDKEILEYAQSINNKDLERTAAFHCAYYYNLKAKSIEELEPYIQALAKYPEDSTVIRMIRAQFYMNHGDYNTAERLIRNAKVENDYWNTPLLYAKILNKQGKYAKSIEILKRLEKENPKDQESYNWIEVYQLLADNYHATGDNEKAFLYQKRYDQLKDSVSTKIHIEQINLNRVKYEVDKKNQKIEQQQIINRQQLIMASAIIAFLVIFIIVYYLYERRYKRFARNIVQQHKEAIASERSLRQRLEQLTEEKNKVKNSESPQVSDTRLEEIFEKIRYEMEVNEVYRDPTINRDTFSERVGCNHTYFTHAIKTKTGMSYTQFMNNYRIRKAVEVLSDNSNQTSPQELSKQLGFTAVSTFYSAFKKQVGISPDAYYKTALEMNKERVSDD